MMENQYGDYTKSLSKERVAAVLGKTPILDDNIATPMEMDMDAADLAATSSEDLKHDVGGVVGAGNGVQYGYFHHSARYPAASPPPQQHDGFVTVRSGKSRPITVNTPTQSMSSTKPSSQHHQNPSVHANMVNTLPGSLPSFSRDYFGNKQVTSSTPQSSSASLVNTLNGSTGHQSNGSSKIKQQQQQQQQQSSQFTPSKKGSAGSRDGVQNAPVNIISIGGTVTENGFRYHNPSNDPLIYMLMYKTEKCTRKPCSRLCEKYHSIKERRRSPLQYRYNEHPCGNVKIGNSAKSWGDPTKCPHGENCESSHTLLEQMYHPNIYKTGLCNKFNQDPQLDTCTWGNLCTHAHGALDRERQIQALNTYKRLLEEEMANYQAGIDDNSPGQEENGSVGGDLHVDVDSDPFYDSIGSDRKFNVNISAPPSGGGGNSSANSKPMISRSFTNDRVIGRSITPSGQDALYKPLVSSLALSSPLSQVMGLGISSQSNATNGSGAAGNAQNGNRIVPPFTITRALSGPLANRGFNHPSFVNSSMDDQPAPVPSQPSHYSVGNSSGAASSALNAQSLHQHQMFALNRAATVGTPYGIGNSGHLHDDNHHVKHGVGGAHAPSASPFAGRMEMENTTVGGIWSSNSGSNVGTTSILGRSWDNAAQVQPATNMAYQANLKWLCPKCGCTERSTIVDGCRHFLCEDCASDSVAQRRCVVCGESCNDQIQVRF